MENFLRRFQISAGIVHEVLNPGNYQSQAH